MTQVNADTKLAEAPRKELTRNYLGRTIVLLREAIDAEPRLPAGVDTDPAFETIRTHPVFNTLIERHTN